MTTAVENARVAFDIAEGWTFEGYMLIPPALALVGLVIALMNGGKGASGRQVFNAVIGWFMFLFSGAITILWGSSFLATFTSLRDARLSGRHAMVEGCLEAFHPMPEAGHDSERIRVGGKTFEYSDYVSTPAFNRSESHGGPIHRDSWVRIAYVGGDIIRLEVADGACPPQTRDVPPMD